MTAYARESFSVCTDDTGRTVIAAQTEPQAEQPTQNQKADLIFRLRSVNNRFLDLSLSLPKELYAFHDQLAKLIRARILRGKIDAVVRLIPPTTSANSKSDDDAGMDFCISSLQKLYQMRAGVPMASADPVALIALARSAGGSTSQKTPSLDIDWQWPVLLPCFEQVLDQFQSSRESEGAAILGHLSENIANCEALLKQLNVLRKTTREQTRQNLLDEVEKLTVNHNPERLEEELLYLIKRHDIEEEYNRFLAHLLALKDVLGLGEKDSAISADAKRNGTGKRVTFLLQEMHREANTMGSKAPNHESSTLGIEIKLELERMREQVANLE